MEPPIVKRSSGSFNNVWAKEGTTNTWQQGSSAEVDARPVIGGELDILVMSGSGLAPKDTSLLGKKSSDPFVVLSCGGKKLGKTPTIKKNLNPVWNAAFKLNVDAKDALRLRSKKLTFAVFDYDMLSANDPMGEVEIPLEALWGGQVVEAAYPVMNCKGCNDASGVLQIKASMLLRHALCLGRNDTMTLTQPKIAVGLGWDPLWGEVAIDLDASCVCVDGRGEILMGECVYFAQLANSNGSITHTGDEREGDEDLGEGDDEVIVVDLKRVPQKVTALFFIGTVCDEPRTFADVKEARMRVVDWGTGAEMFRYVPASKGAHTAIFMCRVLRQPDGTWLLSMIGEVDHTARDFGSLVPEVKGYMSDVIPNIQVRQDERVALMRKGGTARLADYFGALLTKPMVFGLGWDVARGASIDLDASAIMLDGDLKLLDLVFFNKLTSNDGALKHTGDNLTGEGEGDDEQIIINLSKVHPAVKWIGLTINSYSGQELDDVRGASCHLFDPSTKRDVAEYKLTGASHLDKRTALLMALLYRDPAASTPAAEWCLRIVSEPADGRTAQNLVPALSQWIRQHPPTKLPSVPPGGARMLARTPTASAAMLAAHPSGRMIAPGGAVGETPPVVLGQVVDMN